MNLSKAFILATVSVASPALASTSAEDAQVISWTFGLTLLAMCITFFMAKPNTIFLRSLATITVGVPGFFLSLILTYSVMGMLH